MKARRTSAGSQPSISLSNIRHETTNPEEETLIYDTGDIWRPPMVDTSKLQAQNENIVEEKDYIDVNEIQSITDLDKRP